MTQDDPSSRLDAEMQAPLHRDADDDEADDVTIRPEKTSVKDMILRFESAISLSESSDSLVGHNTSIGSLTNIANPFQTHYQHLCPVTKSQDRNSTVSVNSILSNASEVSYESSSSGFVSDRKSGIDFLVPHRPAPPPPETFNDSSSTSSKSSAHEEMTDERRFSFTSTSSPVVVRRVRQPPVIRRKSLVSNHHLGETLWSYGVKQRDLEELLCLKRSEVSDTEEEERPARVAPLVKRSISVVESDNEDSSDDTEGSEQIANKDDGREDSISRDHSTDTLINDNGENSDGDNSSVASDVSDARSAYDNVSIKSISSFDMVPYQKYDSITVSSDEFGSEVCHAPDTEFLTVSAVNEWCITNSAEPTLLPIETKQEKYRR